jgi:hypothetical protein
MDTKEAGQLGGKARAKLPKKTLSEINRRVAKKRWAKRKEKTY